MFDLWSICNHLSCDIRYLFICTYVPTLLILNLLVSFTGVGRGGTVEACLYGDRTAGMGCGFRAECVDVVPGDIQHALLWLSLQSDFCRSEQTNQVIKVYHNYIYGLQVRVTGTRKFICTRTDCRFV